MSKQNGHDIQEDFMAEGFYKLDENIVDLRAPRLTEPPKFAARTDGQKYLYYRKVAATMNHAAKLVSEERNNLNDLLIKKEEQLKAMIAQVNENNAMVQSEVTKMNKQKQGFHAEVSRLTARIRELESGNID